MMSRPQTHGLDVLGEQVVLLGRTGVGDCWYAPVSVGGTSCYALVDTGSSATLVKPEVLDNNTTVLPTSCKLLTVTGERAPMVGETSVTLKVGRETVYFPVWVAELEDSILGLDVLGTLDCVINTKRGTLSFPDGHVVQMIKKRPQEQQPRTHTAVLLGTDPAHTATPDIHSSSDASVPASTAPVASWGLKPIHRTPVPATSAVHGDTGVPEPQQLLQPISPASPPYPTPNLHSPPVSDTLAESNERVTTVKEVWRKNCDGLTTEEQNLLWQLLLEFKDCFSCSGNDVGHTDLIQHDIDTGDTQPIKMRPRRLPLARQAAADRALLEMQQAGIIEPSTSSWASPVVMVPKKTVDDWRFCADYRPLNRVTKKDPYPLPRIDETLDTVAGSSWFSSLDLRSGYWQVPLSPKAKPKTAFITSGGLWQFKVLPFGLCNAPATFMRLMDRTLEGIPKTECVVYLDDILTHGSSFKTALGALRRVLERLLGAGLKLHPQKCRFMRREVTFLGHKLGDGGVHTIEEKVHAVMDWPTPGSVLDLKSFLGLASYYRRFVKGFSCIAAPLFNLLRKGVPFKWTKECDKAFATLQRALVEAPVLSPPDINLHFILDTDASSTGAGAVLSQVTPMGERVVAYYSRTFTKTETRYCVTRRELLAVVSAIRHFRYYLGGLHFTVRTDHSALQWLTSFKEPEGQLARWIEELQTYDFTVVHRSGAKHGNADALSRRPCHAGGCQYCEKREAAEEGKLKSVVSCAAVGLGGQLSDLVPTAVEEAEWEREQSQDADISPVLSWMARQNRPPWEDIALYSRATKGLWSMFETLRLHGGVLQRGWKEPATGEIRWQVVVPKSLKLRVLQATHGLPGSGHFGVTKTLRRLRQGFYWGQQRRDVEDYCRRCDICTARKGPTNRSHAQLQQFPVGTPMERVGIDILGPFPRTEKGNRYVLTAMDYFTKWPEAYSLPDQEAETIVDALLDGMFSRFGVPDTIHTDQGRNFESRLFAAMCKQLGAHKTRTTPLHPQSDGLVERFNRTLAQQLAMVTAKHQRDWDNHLPLVLMAYRSVTQDSTSCSPALLMLGREVRTPAEMVVGRPPDAPVDPPGPEYARKLQDRLDSAHEFARAQLLRAGARQKRNYDVRARGRHFPPGELVWVYSPQRKKGRCPKLDSHWVGPCRVLERVGEVVYRVHMTPGGRRVILHRDRLAPYQGMSSPQSVRQEACSSTAPNSGSFTPTLSGSQDVPSGIAQSPPSSPAHTTRGSRPQRGRRAPAHLTDFVCSLRGEEL